MAGEVMAGEESWFNVNKMESLQVYPLILLVTFNAHRIKLS